jgi:hypothetical protein
MMQKEFIRNELRYRYPNLADHIAAPQQVVGRPLMFEAGAHRFGARIILAYSFEINSLRSTRETDALFLSIGMPEQDVFDALDVCVLPVGESQGAVLNFIQRLFDRLDDWTQSLRQAAENGEGVEELLHRASGILQNPVLLLDERGHIVASSESFDITFSYDGQFEQKQNQSDSRTDRVLKVTREKEPDFLSIGFRAANSNFSLVCLESERPLYSSDEIVLDSLAGFLRLMLSERTLRLGAERKQRTHEEAAKIFRAMLSQELPEREASESLSKLGWSAQDDYAVLAIEPMSGLLRAADADAICDQLESGLEGCCAFAQLPIIVAMIRTDYLKQPELLSRLQSLAAEHALIIGVCEAFSGFFELLQRKEMATRALNRAEQTGGVACYADLFEEELAGNACSVFSKELLCLRSVLSMAQYDRAHETNYLETAEQYVKNRFNAVRTAVALFIHRSTFLYRLERIREQFGLDLDDGKLSLLHLLYSFRVVRSEH